MAEKMVDKMVATMVDLMVDLMAAKKVGRMVALKAVCLGATKVEHLDEKTVDD